MPVSAVTPHIVVSDAAAAASWYAQALGAEERRRITLPGGKVMSLELRFGELPVMVADEFPEMDVLGPSSIGGTPVVLHLLTDDVDPFGHRWGLSQHLRDVPDDEIARAAAEAFG
jgi:PhnB protein